LTKVFDENYFAKEEDAAQACRSACYSDLGCQWWYYNQVKGCFVEDISQEAVPVFSEPFPRSYGSLRCGAPLVRGKPASASEHVSSPCGPCFGCRRPCRPWSRRKSWRPWLDEGFRRDRPSCGGLHGVRNILCQSSLDGGHGSKQRAKRFCLPRSLQEHPRLRPLQLLARWWLHGDWPRV